MLGSRIYVPRRDESVSPNEEWLRCHDYSTSASCQFFPIELSDMVIVYSVVKDPYRSSGIWINSHDGNSQIQAIDAFTGGNITESEPRISAGDFFAQAASTCTPPTAFDSLTIVAPEQWRGRFERAKRCADGGTRAHSAGAFLQRLSVRRAARGDARVAGSMRHASGQFRGPVVVPGRPAAGAASPHPGERAERLQPVVVINVFPKNPASVTAFPSASRKRHCNVTQNP